MNLTSTAPGVWNAFLGLIQTATTGVTVAINAEGVTAYDQFIPSVEPTNYVVLVDIYNQKWTPEGIGYQFREDYLIRGYATIATGASPGDDPTVPATVRTQTWGMYNTCVQTVMVDNANLPIFDTNPSPFQGLPTASNYTAGTGKANGGGQVGWYGRIDFAYRFSALVLPA